MKEIYYVNSEGTKISFSEYPFFMLRDTNLFDYEWDYTTTGYNYPRVVGYNRNMKSMEINLYVQGRTEEEYLDNLEYLLSVIDSDVFDSLTGTLFVGEYYIHGNFIKSSKTNNYLKSTRSCVTLTFLTEDSTWRTYDEQSISVKDIPYSSSREQTIISTVSKSPRTITKDFDLLRITALTAGYAVVNLYDSNDELVDTIGVTPSMVSVTDPYNVDVENIQYVTFSTPIPIKNYVSFILANNVTSSQNTDYMYDYTYDLVSSTNIVELENSGSYGNGNWQLTVRGPATNPCIYIGNNIIKVFVTLTDYEELVIDSKEKTIEKVNINNQISENVFDLRTRENDVFELLDSGDVDVSWTGFKYCTIILFKDRSEPKWI